MAIQVILQPDESSATITIDGAWEATNGVLSCTSAIGCYIASISRPDGSFLFNALGTVDDTSKLRQTLSLQETFISGTYIIKSGVLNTSSDGTSLLAVGGEIIAADAIISEQVYSSYTIKEYLEKIKRIKDDIKDAIIYKGVSIEDSLPFAYFADSIRRIASCPNDDSGSGSVDEGSSDSNNTEGDSTVPTTATPYTILSGYTAYSNGELITGNIPTVGMHYDSDSAVIRKGYLKEDIILPIVKETRISPGKNDIIIPAGSYLTHDLIISGDINLDPSKIKYGCTIFNVTGEYRGDVSDNQREVDFIKANILKGI